MRGMQVKQPFVLLGLQNALLIHVPSSGYENAIFKFAAKDEGAAEYLVLEYSSSQEQREWTSDGLPQSIHALSGSYQLYTADFTSLPLTDDNPDFWVRIRFGGSNLQADAGERVSFNNFSLEANPLGFSLLAPEQINIALDNGFLSLSWEQVSGANAYLVYSSSHPQSQHWEMIGLVASPIWQSPMENLQSKMFYRVKALRN
jgi:hypothetical protein